MFGIGVYTFYNYVFSEPTKVINIASEFIGQSDEFKYLTFVIIFLFGVIFPNNSIFKCCLRCLMCRNFYSNSGDERKSLVKHESPDKQNGGPRSYSGTIPTTNENFKNVLYA